VLENCELNDFSPARKRTKTAEAFRISYNSSKQIYKQV
jgi:hypothetical protein